MQWIYLLSIFLINLNRLTKLRTLAERTDGPNGPDGFMMMPDSFYNSRFQGLKTGTNLGVNRQVDGPTSQAISY